MSKQQHLAHAVRDRDGMAVLGRTLHELRGIRFENGEGGGVPAGDPAPPAPTPTPPAAPPAPVPPAPKPTPPVPEPPRQSDEDYAKSLREEAKAYRLERDAERQRAAALEQERDQARTDLAKAQRTGAIARLAPTAGANATLLLDSSGFAASLDGVNLADDAAVKQHITTWLDSHAEHKAGPALPPTSGGGTPTGTGTPPTQPTSLGAAVTAALGGGQ